MSARRRKIVAAVAVALLGALVAANFVLGSFVRDRIAAGVERRVQGDVAVDLGSRPMLLDLAEQQIPDVAISAPAASTCRFEGFSLDARLSDVSLSSPASFDSIAVDVGITPRTLQGVAERQLRQPRAARLLRGLEADPAGEQLILSVGPAGVVRVGLRPVLHGRTIGLRVTAATVLGRELPAPLMERLRSRLDVSRTIPKLPLGLRADSVGVDAAGVVVHLSGGAGRLDPSSRDRHRGCAVNA